MLKKKFDFDADGNRNTFPGKTPCTPSKALQAHFHSFCCFAVQEHNKKNWNQLENHGNRYNCHGRAVPLFGSHSGPKRVFIPQRAPVKQSARPSRVSDRRYLFKLTSAAAGLLSLCQSGPLLFLVKAGIILIIFVNFALHQLHRAGIQGEKSVI